MLVRPRRTWKVTLIDSKETGFENMRCIEHAKERGSCRQV
jgi:hypothetical protein